MTHLKLQKKLHKGDITQQHIDDYAMCWVITFLYFLQF